MGSDHDSETFPALEAWLTQKELGRRVGEVWTPNPTAIVLFGLSPQTFFPGAVVEMVRYGGIEIDAPVVWRKTISGTLPDQLYDPQCNISALFLSEQVLFDGAQRTGVRLRAQDADPGPSPVRLSHALPCE